MEEGGVHLPIICLLILLPTHLCSPLPGLVAQDEEWVRTNRMESLGCKERVNGAASDLCFPYWPLLLHLGVLNCLVWLGHVAEARGQWAMAQSPAGPHLAQTRLHRALLSASMGSLSSAGNSQHPPHPPSAGGGERGRGAGLAQSPGWPHRQSPAAQFWPAPHSSLTYLTICPPMSSLLLDLGQVSQLTFLSYRALPFCGPFVLHLSGLLLLPYLCLVRIFPIF